MIAVTKRNLRVFFRDKSAVFFSLLALFIIIGLYVLFLGDSMTNGMENVKNAKFLMDSWIIAGLLAVSSVTSTMGAFGIMVEDKSRKILKDFYSSPLSRKALAGGYILSSYIVGIIISLIALILGEIYIVANGGNLLTLLAFVKTLGCIGLSVLASSSMVFFIVSFFKSQNAFAAASTVIGTLIGFLTGVYIPIGALPEAVQFVIKIFPVSHAGSLFRQIFMEIPMTTAFGDVNSTYALNFQRELGLLYEFGSHPVSLTTSVLILIATAILFYGLAILNISMKSK